MQHTLTEHALTARTGILDAMGNAQARRHEGPHYDDIVTAGTSSASTSPSEILFGELLSRPRSAEKQRPLHQATSSAIARLPVAKELADFVFDASRRSTRRSSCEMADGPLPRATSATLVFIGGTGTGKSHLAIGIARACIRAGFKRPVLQRRRPGQPARGRGPRRTAEPAASPTLLARVDFVHPRRARLPAFCPVRWAAPVPPRQPALRANLRDRHHQPRLRRMARRLRRRQDDHRAARPPHPSLRHRRDRQRELAVQEPVSKLKQSTRATRARPGCATPNGSDLSGAHHRATSHAQEGSLLHADTGSRFNAD